MTRRVLDDPVPHRSFVGVRVHAGGWTACPGTQRPEVRVAAEHHGLHHHTCTDARQRRHDIAREGLMEDEGWRVLRVTSDDTPTPTGPSTVSP